MQSSNSINQIARHRSVEAGTANDQMQLANLWRQEDDCLAGRVAGADQRNFGSGAKPGLDRRRPVGNARTFELIEIGNGQPAIACSGSNDYRSGSKLLAFRDGK